MPTANKTAYLAIGSVPMSTAAWDIRNMQELWGDADRRNRDVIVPRTHGRLARRRYKDTTLVVLELVIRGDRDSDGGYAAVPYTQLYTNIAYLKTNVSATVDSGDGTRACTLYLPGGGTLTADCHVGPLKLGSGTIRGVRATLDLSIPAGEFV
jgi:hypothetical protein